MFYIFESLFLRAMQSKPMAPQKCGAFAWTQNC